MACPYSGQATRDEAALIAEQGRGGNGAVAVAPAAQYRKIYLTPSCELFYIRSILTRETGISSLFKRSLLWADEGEDVPGAPAAPQRRINLLTWDPAGPVPAKPAAAPKPPPETLDQRNNTIDDLMNDPRTAAFLETLGWLESRGHYAVLNGNGKFSGYDRHPQIDTDAGKAAGAYQFKPKTWARAAAGLGVTDFSPASQDRVAVHWLRETGAMDRLMKGDLEGAILATGKQWDTFPSNNHGTSISGAYRDANQIALEYERRLRQLLGGRGAER